MQIILLSGGSGKRLWPLSNNTRSKQFIKLLTAPGWLERVDGAAGGTAITRNRHL